MTQDCHLTLFHPISTTLCILLAHTITTTRQNQSRCSIIIIIPLTLSDCSNRPGQLRTCPQKRSRWTSKFANREAFQQQVFLGDALREFQRTRGSGIANSAERILSTSEIYCWNRAWRTQGQCSTSAVATLKSSGRSTLPDTSALISQRRHSENAKGTAQTWTFVQAPALNASPAELVLCFEVLIHEKSLTGYHQLIHYLAERHKGSLLYVRRL